MHTQDIALAGAGLLGGGVAVIHGLLTQRFIVAPIQGTTAPRLSGQVRRLAAVLLQFSTYNWLLGGLALLACAFMFGPEARLAIGLLVGSSYLFGALGNLWATRGRHPGWALYAGALALLAYGLVPAGPSAP